jgi:phosphonate transport system substrate-binding protein
VVLLTNHFGVYQYGAQFMANVASGFTPYHDPISGLNSVDAATALQQFAGRRPCWVEPLSAIWLHRPGWSAGDQPGTGSSSGSYPEPHSHRARIVCKRYLRLWRHLFYLWRPAHLAAVLDDLPDAMDRVIILWRSDGIIPNLNLSLLAGMQEQDRQAIINAILDIASTPEGKGLLSYAAGDYQIDDIKPVDNGLYDPLRELVDTLNINLNDMIGK